MSDFDSKPKKTRRIASERRRLTLGVMDRPADLNPRLPTDNSGLINFLKSQRTSDISRSQAKRKLSLSSITNEVGQDSFEEKSTTDECGKPNPNVNVKLEVNKLGIGVACKKGLKPESPNQDSFSLVYNSDEFLLTGVYDGHGAHGHHVSHFVKDILPKLLLNDPNRIKNPKAAFLDSFQRCQRLIEHSDKQGSLQAMMSGTTVTLVYIPLDARNKGKVWVAHCGDSRVAMISHIPGTNSSNPNSLLTLYPRQVQGRNCTEDHKPSIPAEKRRIEEAGGRVIFDGFYNHRVFARGQMYPGLNMSRALGDIVGHREAGLSGVPEVTELTITSSDVAMLLCTDGVWEFVSAEDAAKECAGKGVQRAVEDLARQSWDHWMADSENEISDDITAVIVEFGKLFAAPS